jgi:hypothetical protein
LYHKSVTVAKPLIPVYKIGRRMNETRRFPTWLLLAFQEWLYSMEPVTRYFNSFNAEYSLGKRHIYTYCNFNNYEEYVEFARYDVTFALIQTVET